MYNIKIFNESFDLLLEATQITYPSGRDHNSDHLIYNKQAYVVKRNCTIISDKVSNTAWVFEIGLHKNAVLPVILPEEKLYMAVEEINEKIVDVPKNQRIPIQKKAKNIQSKIVKKKG